MPLCGSPCVLDLLIAGSPLNAPTGPLTHLSGPRWTRRAENPALPSSPLPLLEVSCWSQELDTVLLSLDPGTFGSTGHRGCQQGQHRNTMCSVLGALGSLGVRRQVQVNFQVALGNGASPSETAPSYLRTSLYLKLANPLQWPLAISRDRGISIQ